MTPSREADVEPKQSIEQLQTRYQTLNTRKIQAEAHLESATKQLDALKKEAREKYGTDDVGQLREKLAAMAKENEEKRRAYQSALDQIERDLKVVEDKFAAAEAPAADNGAKK
jgi:hypothetical protein